MKTNMDVDLRIRPIILPMIEDNSYTVINVDSIESPYMEIYYKGKKINNVIQVILTGAGFWYDDGTKKVLNWRKIIEND